MCFNFPSTLKIGVDHCVFCLVCTVFKVTRAVFPSTLTEEAKRPFHLNSYDYWPYFILIPVTSGLILLFSVGLTITSKL